jgi:hypothetical protein
MEGRKENMKLSELRVKEAKKKITFIEGKMEVEDFQSINGDIDIFDLDTEVLNSINENVVKQMEKLEDNSEFMYRLIPYVCDLELDIPYNEVLEMLDNPSKAFVGFVNIIVELISDLFEMLESVENIVATSNKVQEKTIMSEEQQLEMLYDKLNESTDKEDKKKIIGMINALENKGE